MRFSKLDMNGVTIENVFSSFTFPRSEGWTTVDQLKTSSKADNSFECGSSNSESSSSDTLKLIKKTADMTIWSINRNTNDCSSSVAEPISRIASLASCIETPPDHRKTYDKAEISAQWQIQKGCEQYTSTVSEFSTSGTLNLIVKTSDITIWSNKPNNNYCSSSSTIAETPTPYHQNDIVSRKRKPRAKLDSHQLQVLKERFSVCPYIIGRPRRDLAKRLGLSENKIGEWFEYRRRLNKKARMSSGKDKQIPDYSLARL